MNLRRVKEYSHSPLQSTSAMWYSRRTDRFTTVLMEKEAIIPLVSSLDIFHPQCILLPQSTVLSEAMILSVIWSEASIKSRLSKVVFPPTCLHGCTAGTHILLETKTRAPAPAGNQCSPKERFCSSQVSSLIRPKHGKASTLASITETGRRAHAARVLGEDRTASTYTDWWPLPSQAAFSFNTSRADNVFSYFPKLEFLEKPLSTIFC